MNSACYGSITWVIGSLRKPPSPPPTDLLPPTLWAMPSWPQCGLASLLYSLLPWAGFLFLLILSTYMKVNFPYRLSHTMERNSRDFVSSSLNSLCREQCLEYNRSSINTSCYHGQVHKCSENLWNQNKWDFFSIQDYNTVIMKYTHCCSYNIYM